MFIDNAETKQLQELERLEEWIASPSKWVKDHINIELANYRGKGEIRSFLDAYPEQHHWLRRNQKELYFNENTSYQKEALDKMAKPGFYAYQWANGCAKTTTAALFILWFLDTHPGGKVITTAGTWSQLVNQLWREVKMWNERSEGTVVKQAGVNQSSINIAPDWFAFGRAAKSEATFEGIHGQYVAVVMDEAKAIKPEIFSAVRRILRGNIGGKFWWVCLSSPGSPSGPFYDICQGDQANRWNVFRLSAYQSERVPLSQIHDDSEDLGENSPLFVAMDLGEFPDETDDTIIPISWVQAAIDREELIEDHKTAMAVDLARFGADETCFIRFDGRRASVVKTYTGKDLMTTVGYISQMAGTVAKIAIDDVGLGGGVTDRCRELELGKKIIPVNAGAQARDPEKYANLGTEMMWNLREAFEENYKSENGDVISIPNDKMLIHQLSARKFDITSNGKIQIESKSKMKKRGERSPDRADTLSMAWWAKKRASVDNSAVYKVLAGAHDNNSPVAKIRTMKF